MLEGAVVLDGSLVSASQHRQALTKVDFSINFADSSHKKLKSATFARRINTYRNLHPEPQDVGVPETFIQPADRP